MTNPTDQGNAPAELARRLQAMEELYMHLQRTVSDLDQVIVAQGRRLDELEKKIGAAVELIRTVSTAPAGPAPTLLDEKPPHY